MTRDDLIDIIVETVMSIRDAEIDKAQYHKRVFISDWELRRMRSYDTKTIKLPKGAIISPLASDWIDFEGIEIIFE